MPSFGPQSLELQSFPGPRLTLPAGSQVLIPGAVDTPDLDRPSLIGRIQERVQRTWAAAGPLPERRACRVLLLLPDKTRRQTASRLTLDALIDLCERDPCFSLTLLFGLGTHPRMTPQDLSAILEPERERRLSQLAVPVLQQTTLSSLACRNLQVSDPRDEAQGSLTLQVPELLWRCDLLLVAGDTDLHPYEGRAGSGGIHKMLAIGVGCMSSVRITHALDVLTHPETRPGASGNRFVQLVDSFALQIIRALRATGPLQADPIGISVVSRQQDRVEAFWMGDREEERAGLMEPLLRERTLRLRENVELVVADTEQEKGTDLLAGARNLHLLCNLNTRDNPILCPKAVCCSALLFNACHAGSHGLGIGNSGTVLHLQALLQFSQERWRSLLSPEEMQRRRPGALPVGQWDLHRRLKTTILDRWEKYLHLVSNEEQVFGELEQALEEACRSEAVETIRLMKPLALLNASLPHSFGAHRHLFEGCRSRLLDRGPLVALDFLRQSSDRLGFKGLGEGGQRALRLLALLRTFDQLHVATANPVVLHFIDQFNPPAVQANNDGGNPVQAIDLHPFGLIGLHGLSLRTQSPQQALERVLEDHDQICRTKSRETERTGTPMRRLAFVQQPVILRSPAQAMVQAPRKSGDFEK